MIYTLDGKVVGLEKEGERLEGEGDGPRYKPIKEAAARGRERLARKKERVPRFNADARWTWNLNQVCMVM